MAAMASVDQKAVFGLYDPFFLYVRVKYPLDAMSVSPAQLLQKQPTAPIIHYALARYAALHEMRHFHDCFGTCSGISLFEAHFQQLHAFCAFLEAVHVSGETVALPLDEAAIAHQGLKEKAHALRRNWTQFMRATATFGDAYEKTIDEVPREKEFVVYKIRGPGLPDAPTFPVSTVTVSRRGKLPRTLYYPIGFTVLVEGVAQALQRSVMEAECSEALAKRIATPPPLTTNADTLEPDLLAGIPPYTISDLFVSKYLRLNGHPTFRRAAILQLTDIALNTAYIHAVSKPWETPARFEILDVGNVFVELLTGAKLKDVVSGNVPYPDVAKAIHEELLASYRKSPRPETVELKSDFISAVEHMRAIVVHEVICPILERRIETGHRIFWDLTEYMRRLKDLPVPPAKMEADDFSYAHYMHTENGPSAWIRYAILANLMHEVLSGAETVACFRARYVRSPLINLCQQGSCIENMAACRCDPWRGDDPPACLFTAMARLARLVPKAD